ncbi:hypothetical protein PybrP1_003780 [[Pythium] brassicae (nom. inval.)]|nr:hypothetical protein PybrP1_003780 [[Pythium] brassicae (nom. inval.)]
MPTVALSHSPSCAPRATSTPFGFATTHVDTTLALAADHAALDCDLWEMALLSCARKHRSLLWYKYHHSVLRRSTLAAMRKQQLSSRTAAFTQTSATPFSSAAIAMLLQPLASVTVAPPPLTTAAGVSPLSTPEPTFAETASSSCTPTTALTNAVAANETASSADASVKQPPTRESKAPPSPPPSSGSWRAMLVTLFAMISPEWGKESMELENDFLDDLRVKSVPSHISEVVASKDKAMFWRYDMDSYAANRHNEDRSQYIHDTFTDEVTGEATPLFFCACYDGHGGEQAVEFVQRKLFANIKARLVAGGESTKLSIINGFRDTDEEFHRQSRRKFQKGEWTACSVGACAVIALMVGPKLFVASCGDCRAIMAFRDASGALSVEQITADHSANEVGEQRRLRVLHPDDYDIVREIGARNFYVKGRLQPTRSLGDTYMKVKDVNKAPMPRGLRIHGSFKRPYITAVPDVFEVDVAHRHPEFLVLGSDGLYGEMSNMDIARHVAKFRDAGAPNVSAALREAVLERVSQYYGFSVADMEDIVPGERRNYHDDITIDVLHFSPPSTDCAAPHAAAA